LQGVVTILQAQMCPMAQISELDVVTIHTILVQFLFSSPQVTIKYYGHNTTFHTLSPPPSTSPHPLPHRRACSVDTFSLYLLLPLLVLILGLEMRNTKRNIYLASTQSDPKT
jgi:hypothetical protein